MRKWGIVITLLYALMVVGLIFPGAILLVGNNQPSTFRLYHGILDSYRFVWAWIPIASLLCGEAALLFLPVDTSRRHLKRNTPNLISGIAAAMLFGLLTFAAIFSVGVTIYSDKFLKHVPVSAIALIAVWSLVWGVWGILFRRWTVNSQAATSRAVSWLLKRSLLQLLIAVPCDVIVRRRHDCPVPVATGFGIASGISIMLLAFGPGVLLLFKKRLDAEVARAISLMADKTNLVRL